MQSYGRLLMVLCLVMVLAVVSACGSSASAPTGGAPAGGAPSGADVVVPGGDTSGGSAPSGGTSGGSAPSGGTSGGSAPSGGTSGGSAPGGVVPITGGDSGAPGSAPGSADVSTVQGQVAQIEGQKLVVKSVAGSSVTVQLTDSTKVQKHERVDASTIQVGDSLSAIALPMNGNLQVIEVQIGGERLLPPGLPNMAPGASGAPVIIGQGGGAPGAPAGVPQPQSIRGTVDKIDGSTLTLKTEDGQSTAITLSPQTFIQKISEGAVGDIKPGAQVIAAGKRNGSEFDVTQLNLMLNLPTP